MKTFKLLCWCICITLCATACSENQDFNDGAVEKSLLQHEFIYQGHKYSVPYEIVDSVTVYDESDSATCLYFRLQENPNLAVLVENEQKLLLFDSSEKLVDYISSKKSVKTKQTNFIRTKSSFFPSLIFFEHGDYQGESFGGDSPLEYPNLANIAHYPVFGAPASIVFNDEISSFKFTANASNYPSYTYIVFYEHVNFGGKSIAFSWGTSVPNFKSYTMKSSLFSKTTWNDQISSIKLMY